MRVGHLFIDTVLYTRRMTEGKNSLHLSEKCDLLSQFATLSSSVNLAVSIVAAPRTHGPDLLCRSFASSTVVEVNFVAFAVLIFISSKTHFVSVWWGVGVWVAVAVNLIHNMQDTFMLPGSVDHCVPTSPNCVPCGRRPGERDYLMKTNVQSLLLLDRCR